MPKKSRVSKAPSPAATATAQPPNKTEANQHNNPKPPISDATDVWFLGISAVQLFPYHGLVESRALEKHDLFHLCPEPNSAGKKTGARGVLSKTHSQQALDVVHSTNVGWKAQFGSFIVFFGEKKGLALAEKDKMTSGSLSNTQLKNIFTHHKCSTFTSFTVSSIEEGVRAIRSELNVTAKETVHALRVTVKNEKGKQHLYERRGASREEVLDDKPFLAEIFIDEEKCAAITYVPPYQNGSPDNEHYCLFRCVGYRQSKSTGQNDRLQVTKKDTPIEIIVNDRKAAVTYSRVEERHILHLKDSDAEVHVVRVEESGVSVTEKKNHVRIDLRQKSFDGSVEQRRAAWDAFVNLSRKLCRVLSKSFACPAAESNEAAELEGQQGCGESTPSSTSVTRTGQQGCVIVCRFDAMKECKQPNCRFWHGRSEVQSLLTERSPDLKLLSINSLPVKENVALANLLYEAVTSQLQRIKQALLNDESGVAAEEGKDDAPDGQMKEVRRLLQQYNAVAYSMRSRVRDDDAFLFRCCRRLQNPLPLLTARGFVQKLCEGGNRSLLVNSSTGSGKSTLLPQFLAECAHPPTALETGERDSAGRRLTICVEPRALAATSLAHYVACEYDNCKNKFDWRVQALTDATQDIWPRSHIVYTTPHVLLALLQSGRLNLAADVYAVVLDEAHERTVLGDLLLGVLKERMQEPDGNFRLVVCSATMPLSSFQEYLPNAGQVNVSERRHRIEIVYNEQTETTKPACDYVRETVRAVRTIIDDPLTMYGTHRTILQPAKHILAFLPTAADVEAARDQLNAHIAATQSGSLNDDAQRDDAAAASPWRGVCVCTLSEVQPLKQQLEAFKDEEGCPRKVIFATPIAETSVTIDGVGHVVDCGLRRVARYDPDRRCIEHTLSLITRSSAKQRAGRAGRTGPGMCHRLYPQNTHDLFEDYDTPAVRTAPLHAAVLHLANMQRDSADFPWMTAPAADALQATRDELLLQGALEGGDVLRLSPFGHFLHSLDGVAVPLGKMLYEASRSESDTLAAATTLAVAVIERFDDLLHIPNGQTKEALNEALQKFGKTCGAVTCGDVLCGMRVVVAGTSVVSSTVDVSAGDDGGRRDDASQPFSFLRHHVLDDVLKRQRVYWQRVRPDTELPDLQSAMDTQSTALRRLLAECFALQVVVRGQTDTTHFTTVDSTETLCRLGSRSFLRQQCRCAPRELPRLCVFASVSFISTSHPGVLSLCTPVEEAWLPDGVLERVRQAQQQQWTTRVVQLPSALVQKWRAREIMRWLRRPLPDVAQCKVRVDATTNELVLASTAADAEKAAPVLMKTVEHARERHRKACHEVNLNDLCRITCRGEGCAVGETLRGRAAYVTLHFSGPSTDAITCLDLDLSALVEELSEQWSGRKAFVTVRGGAGGASPLSGEWTALVTFGCAADARAFYEGFVAASQTEQLPISEVVPYFERGVRAPPLETTVPTLQVNLRLVLTHDDPEAQREDSGSDASPPHEYASEFQASIRKALPKGAVVEFEKTDWMRGTLHMRICAPEGLVAREVLKMLREVRTAYIHNRALFIDAAYVVEFPLPPRITRASQSFIQDSVSTVFSKNAPQDSMANNSCVPLYEQGSRAVLVRCATAGLLQQAMELLRETSTARPLTLPGDTDTERTNVARAIYFSLADYVRKLNGRYSFASYIFPSQFHLCADDGQLCLFATEETFAAVQGAVQRAGRDCSMRCVSLPWSRFRSRGQANACLAILKEKVRECQARGSRACCVLNQGAMLLIAPPEDVHSALDGVVNIEGTRGVAENGEPAPATCAQCSLPLTAGGVRLLCGHQFCQECLVDSLRADSVTPLQLPLKCPCCEVPLCAGEVELFVSRATQRRVGEHLREQLLRMGSDSSLTQVRPCPNPRCLGVVTKGDGVNVVCSGCDLHYCMECAAVGEVRVWHDGPHSTALDHRVSLLFLKLPLSPQCADCGEDAYLSAETGDVMCGGGHRLLPCCLRHSDGGAPVHDARCRRAGVPPSAAGWAASSSSSADLFHRCRAEELADALRRGVCEDNARCVELIEKLCEKTLKQMPQEWPSDPIAKAGEELIAAYPNPHPVEQISILPYRQAAEEAHNAAENRRAREDAAEAVQALLAKMEDYPGFDFFPSHPTHLLETELFEAVKPLSEKNIVRFDAVVSEAFRKGENVYDAAVLLYAFYDQDAKLEKLLRLYGAAARKQEHLQPFLRLLLCGLQTSHVANNPKRMERKVSLSREQYHAYKAGMAVVWEAPTRCFHSVATHKAEPAEVVVTFRIWCTLYTPVLPPTDTEITQAEVRVVLPAGARLRVQKVEAGFIELAQESDN